MKSAAILKTTMAFLAILYCGMGFGQIASNAYVYEEETENGILTHELKIDKGYFIYTRFTKDPADFISTVGGFYSLENDTMQVKLEFNSDYENNLVTHLKLPYTSNNTGFILDGKSFKAAAPEEQDLDGQWLFATRGPDTGQERRGEAQARKTLKFLINGRFQWIAYHTETFRFSGTGGGTFSSEAGKYIENIEYFSRDNERVGAKLEFNYELKGSDWHHTGKNSKGAPMYEIWARRD